MSSPVAARTFTVVEVPGGRFLLGHLPAFKQRPLPMMTDWWRRHGDFLRFRLGPKPMYLLSHPDLAEEVLVHQAERFVKVYDPQRPSGLGLVLGNGLVTSSGDAWKRHRRIIQPIFHRSRMTAMADRMAEVGERRLAGWDTRAPDAPLDMAAEMMQLALEVISQTMFSTSVAHETAGISRALRVSLRYAFNSFHNPLRAPAWVPTRTNREFREALRFVDGLMYRLIGERRRSGARHDDLLDLLLHARDEETGAGLADQQLRDEALTIFSAGHETTANALAWTWYLLATHPEVRARFHDELDRVLQGRAPTGDDLSQLPYTRAVFEESLRLFPPAPAVQRKAAAPVTVGGVPLPVGAIVLVSLHNLHRHPDFWKEADDFKPERFLEHPERHRCAYMPFGAGPRACVGTYFALVEGPLLLALIGRRYDLHLVPGHPVESELMVTLRPKYGLLMTLRPRESAIE